MKPIACYVGLHAWHLVVDEDQMRAIVCLRCGKREVPDANVALRLGFDAQNLNH